MNTFPQHVATLAMFGIAATSFGHGHPIIVTAENNRLVVSGGVPGTEDGYASRIYVETDSDGDPKDAATFSGFGPAVYWDVPGFEISGLAENSGLYLQPLARPVKWTVPVESRTLWYWNPNSSQVDKTELAPISSQMQLRASAAENALLTPSTFIAPPAFQFAEPVASDMGSHNHNLMKYLLPAPLPPDGAYGFFAQLTSDVYEPSDPFLVVINSVALEGSDMLAAAASINRNALLAGDYNHDDVVDAVDYSLWRSHFGNTVTPFASADGNGDGLVNAADYAVWRDHATSGGATANAVAASAPELSGTAVIAITAILMLPAMHRHFRLRDRRYPAALA